MTTQWTLILSCSYQSGMDTVSSNNSSDRCFEFSKSVADAILIIKVVMSSIGILASFIVVCVVLCTRTYRRFVYRLFMYLMLITIVHAVIHILQFVPIEVKDDKHIGLRKGGGWEVVCEALGYFDIVISWMGYFIIVWTILYMLALSWQVYRLQTGHNTQPQTKAVHTSHHLCNSQTREAVSVFLVLFSPFLFAWIPFVMNMYGLSGLWCLIKTADKNGCHERNYRSSSIVLLMVMLYGPLMILIVFGFITMIIIVVLLFKSMKYGRRENHQDTVSNTIHQQTSNTVKEIVIVLVFPLIYCVCTLLMLVNRIYSFSHTSATDHSAYYSLWIVHSVADPSRFVIPAFAFLLNPYVWKNIMSQKRFSSREQDTYYDVPPEDDDIDEGITIRPTLDNYGSIDSRNLFQYAKLEST